MNTHSARIALMLVLLSGMHALTGHAQTSPSRTAYKCTVNGKTTYTDNPCLNAVVVDTSPTRGLNQGTGVVRKGADVRREEFHEQMTDALQPIVKMTPEQFESATRRQKLPAAVRAECASLDATVHHEADAARLLAARQRYKALAC